MDNLIYNFTGYVTNNYLNISAMKIQKAYRDHKSYEIKRREDIIKNKKIEKDTSKKDEEEELKFWNLMREKIKFNSYSLKDLGWVYT